MRRKPSASTLTIDQMNGVLDDITFRNFQMRVFDSITHESAIFSLRYEAPNNRDTAGSDDPFAPGLGDIITVTQVFTCGGFDDTEAFVEYVFHCIQMLCEHEEREDFYYKGVRRYDPHLTVAERHARIVASETLCDDAGIHRTGDATCP